MMNEKNFNNWNELKKDLHFNKKRELHIKEREIILCLLDKI